MKSTAPLSLKDRHRMWDHPAHPVAYCVRCDKEWKYSELGSLGDHSTVTLCPMFGCFAELADSVRAHLKTCGKKEGAPR